MVEKSREARRVIQSLTQRLTVLAGEVLSKVLPYFIAVRDIGCVTNLLPILLRSR